MANWFQLVFQMQAKLSYSTRLVLFFCFCNEAANFEPNFEFESEFVSCILYLVSCILCLVSECEADVGAAAHRSVSHVSLSQVFTYVCASNSCINKQVH